MATAQDRAAVKVAVRAEIDPGKVAEEVVKGVKPAAVHASVKPNPFP